MNEILKKILKQLEGLLKKYREHLNGTVKEQKLAHLRSMQERLKKEIAGAEKYEKDSYFRQALEKSIETRYEREIKNAEEYIENIINPPDILEIDDLMQPVDIAAPPVISTVNILAESVHLEDAPPKRKEYPLTKENIDKAINSAIKYDKKQKYLDAIFKVLEGGSEHEIKEELLNRVETKRMRNLAETIDRIPHYAERLVKLVGSDEKITDWMLSCVKYNKKCANMFAKIANESKNDILLRKINDSNEKEEEKEEKDNEDDAGEEVDEDGAGEEVDDDHAKGAIDKNIEDDTTADDDGSDEHYDEPKDAMIKNIGSYFVEIRDGKNTKQNYIKTLAAHGAKYPNIFKFIGRVPGTHLVGQALNISVKDVNDLGDFEYSDVRRYILKALKTPEDNNFKYAKFLSAVFNVKKIKYSLRGELERGSDFSAVHKILEKKEAFELFDNADVSISFIIKGMTANNLDLIFNAAKSNNVKNYLNEKYKNIPKEVSNFFNFTKDDSKWAEFYVSALENIKDNDYEFINIVNNLKRPEIAGFFINALTPGQKTRILNVMESCEGCRDFWNNETKTLNPIFKYAFGSPSKHNVVDYAIKNVVDDNFYEMMTDDEKKLIVGLEPDQKNKFLEKLSADKQTELKKFLSIAEEEAKLKEEEEAKLKEDEERLRKEEEESKAKLKEDEELVKKVDELKAEDPDVEIIKEGRILISKIPIKHKSKSVITYMKNYDKKKIDLKLDEINSYGNDRYKYDLNEEEFIKLKEDMMKTWEESLMNSEETDICRTAVDKSTVDNPNYPGHIRSFIQNLILCYGDSIINKSSGITKGYKQSEVEYISQPIIQLYNELYRENNEKKSPPTGTESYVYCPLIWRSLKYAGYYISSLGDEKNDWTQLRSNKEDDVIKKMTKNINYDKAESQLDEAAKKIARIEGWAEYAIYVLCFDKYESYRQNDNIMDSPVIRFKSKKYTEWIPINQSQEFFNNFKEKKTTGGDEYSPYVDYLGGGAALITAGASAAAVTTQHSFLVVFLVLVIMCLVFLLFGHIQGSDICGPIKRVNPPRLNMRI